jgi:error-prone DNA polymerase
MSLVSGRVAYVELHLHSCYSLLEAASTPEELVGQAVKLGYQALAITDHDGLYGAMAFAQACASAALQPITGVELTLAHALEQPDSGPVHLTLLAESQRGYANLCRLITLAYRAGRDPAGRVALDPAHLERHAEGVIALSGCRSSEVVQLLDAGRFTEAAASMRRLGSWFGPANTFVELQHNLVRGDTRRVRRLAELAEHLGLGVVATGNVHYHERGRHRLQDALVAIRHRLTLEGSHRQRRANNVFFLRSPEAMAARFARYPQAIANTVRLAERCAQFNLAEPGALGYKFPDFSRQEGEQRASADEVLARYCWVRFSERYPTDRTARALLETARQQLTTELGLIARHKLAGFFLIYRDIQQEATAVARQVRGVGTVRGGSGLPPGRGRGSSVSSIVCYLIGLSHVDPVANRLFFRRFLNEDLQAVPDIDLDFARDIREQLILRIYERYGHDHAALVCSFATYKLRSAVRDLGKVLGLPPATLDKVARLSDSYHAGNIGDELARLPELAGQVDGPLWVHLAELATQLAGFPRHVGQHVGGMIIASQPLIDLVPVQPAAMAGRFICQWDKDSCDDARFIKIDFLALGMLSLVEECLELIARRGKKVPDLSRITYDARIYDAICRGDTVGLFQVESRAQIQMLPRTQPRTLDELAVQVAIVRPGPIVGGAVNPYVQRRERQRRDPTYQPRADHPMLDGLLRDTLGVVLYQDQVLEVAMRMGGFTPGQANRFRRAMSRRRSQAAMASFGEAFIKGARQRRVPEGVARAIFEKLQAFAAFGFPKSHAYAFAVLAYQSAWLRRYFPAEYYAALFNNQPMGFYSPHVLVGDARRAGLQILPVAINRSGVDCLPGEQQILLGLTSVRGLGRELAQEIVAEREAHGRYRTLAGLIERTDLPRRVAENLIAVGALGDLGLRRRELLWQLGLLLPGELGGPRRMARSPQQRLALPIEQDQVSLRDMDAWERMVADYGLLGLSPSFHPLGLLRERLPNDLQTAVQLHASRDGARARTAGLVVCRQRPGTAHGFVFLLLEDETGLVNVVVSPKLYEARRSLVRGESYLCVEGTVQLRSGSLNLLATEVTNMAQLPIALLPPEQAGGSAETEQAERSSGNQLTPEQRALAPASHDFY